MNTEKSSTTFHWKGHQGSRPRRALEESGLKPNGNGKPRQVWGGGGTTRGWTDLPCGSASEGSSITTGSGCCCGMALLPGPETKNFFLIKKEKAGDDVTRLGLFVF